jgi:LemA protein
MRSFLAMITMISLSLAVFFLVFLVAVAGSAITLYNSLVQVRIDIDSAWSNIDVLLKQRHDELGKLLDAVKAYMGYEQSVLTQITQLRRQTVNAGDGTGRLQAESQLTTMLRRLFAVAENYPQLRASESFQQLQGAITQMETEIAHRREFYNAAVNINNARLAQFPDMLLAGIAGLRLRAMFAASEDENTDLNVGGRLTH